MAQKWTAEDIPDQHGRTALVTGACPAVVQGTKRANDHEDAIRLWEISKRLTGVRYDFSAK